MAGLTVYNYALIDEANLVFGSVKTEIDRILDQLEADAAPVVGEWEGEAKIAYKQRQDAWRASQAQITELLRQAVDTMKQAVIDMQARDAKNAANLAG